MDKKQATEIKVNIAGNERVMSGAYANNVLVHMNREEFVLDFISLFPPNATLNARIVVAPANFKRMMRAMADSLARYEHEFGELCLPQAPQQQPVIVQ
ncbi:MAG: DUF3467 domain-containing protein [bacterium]